MALISASGRQDVMTDQPERASEIDQSGDRAPGSLPARYGRRALMLGAAATGAGVAASLVGSGLAEAAPDASPPVLLGKTNTTSGTTIVASGSGTGLFGHAHTAGQAGVKGFDTSSGKKGFGVYGQSVNGVGVNGISKNNNGVAGNTSAIGFSGVSQASTAHSRSNRLASQHRGSTASRTSTTGSPGCPLAARASPA